ncbi:hypothetical protein TWF225_006900 [Orbilia oligospora]|nr:hypothetical protein TWF225_006900 [Orbilia oligospora]KAF3246227.1 hypothetical protein TWF128_009035 [Orbilia oligospora]KAF3246228.1 hypothetical protein TWF128_009035 [Orbilia oligospora]KAF3264104.1 hypothetical protein TWF217_003261 [Orbilia oligospora]
MSSFDFHIQILGLENEFKQLEINIHKLEQEQQIQIGELEAAYKSQFAGVSANLFRFIKCICEVDSLLLEQYNNVEPGDISVEEDIDTSEDTIVSLNRIVGQSFQQLEDRLVEGREQLMKEQERAVEEGTTRMGILSSKISNTRSDIELQIIQTENEIEVSVKEKENAIHRKTLLESHIGDMEKFLPRLSQERGSMVRRGVGGGVIAGLGFVVGAAFPILAVGMWVAGGGMAITSGVNASDLSVEIDATKNNIQNTIKYIRRLEGEIADLIDRVPSLRIDLKQFDSLKPKVNLLAEKSALLHESVHKHVEKIVAAKESISIGERKIRELGVDMQGLGYAATRGDLAQNLETIVKKFREGRSQLEERLDTSEMAEMLMMIGDIELKTDEVLAIMGSN